MEKKNYELVAWTRKVEGQEDPDLMMIPSLHYEMQRPYIKGIAHSKSNKEKARLYEQNARFMFKTRYYGDGLRYLCKAALYCVPDEDTSWCVWDTDLGSYMYFFGELRGDFFHLAKEFIGLCHKYGRYDILQEKDSKTLLEIYAGQTQEERDLAEHLKMMKAWK